MTTQPKEAPEELETVRAFVNTIEIESGVEQLDSPAALAGWLAEHGLIRGDAATGAPAGLRAGARALDRAIRLREALREMLLSNNDGRPLDPTAPAVMNEVAAHARLRLRTSADGVTRLEAESDDVDGALGRLLVIVHRSMETGTWLRLKACRNDTCRWAFFDLSRNGCRHWCSMEACGSRQKARTYRQRHRADGSGGRSTE